MAGFSNKGDIMALKNKAHFKIRTTANGADTDFVAKSIKPSFDSLASEDSGRSDDGVMHITWLQSNLRKWEIEMPPCTAEEAYNILSKVQGKTYWITIQDINSSTGEATALKVYTSNSQASCYSGVIRNGIWEGLTFSAIEMGD